MIICSSDIGWGSGVVAVIVTGIMLQSQAMVDTYREGSVTEEPFLTKTTIRLAVICRGCVKERDGRWWRFYSLSNPCSTVYRRNL